MDDKTLMQVIDMVLDRLTKRNASPEEVRQAMSEILVDWEPSK